MISLGIAATGSTPQTSTTALLQEPAPDDPLYASHDIHPHGFLKHAVSTCPLDSSFLTCVWRIAHMVEESGKPRGVRDNAPGKRERAPRRVRVAGSAQRAWPALRLGRRNPKRTLSAVQRRARSKARQGINPPPRKPDGTGINDYPLESGPRLAPAPTRAPAPPTCERTPVRRQGRRRLHTQNRNTLRAHN